MLFKNRKRGSKSRRFFKYFFLLTVICSGLAGFILFFEGDKPQINLQGTRSFIGKDGEINFTVTDKGNGIRFINVWGEQGSLKKQLFSVTFPRNSYIGAVGPLNDSRKINFDAQKEGFKDGAMTIFLETSDFSLRGWLRGNRSIAEKNITIDTVPPQIHILHSEKYISPGGTGIVIYRLSDKESVNGATINDYFNPGFLVGDGRDDTYISFFALPYNTDKITTQTISATDKAGNTAVVPFATIFKKRHFKKDIINVTDGFLNRKIPEFQQHYPKLAGDALHKYLYANNTIRKANNQKISELCKNPSATRLWQGKFSRMAGSTRAGFADHRTYFYNKRAIDKQVHLGMDIASTRRAEVKAANAGKIVFGGYMGIYGNMVLIDHGQGVFSLYSHLSQINVVPGDSVSRKSIIGLTGTTGMAGGDHLHFSMLINGIFVNPKEWWDPRWISVTIENPIINSKL